MTLLEILKKFSVEYEDSHGEWVKVFCPFHPNTNTPSGILNKTSSKFECKSPSCAKRGDVFDFVAATKSMSRAKVQDLCSKVEDDVDDDTNVVPAQLVDGWHTKLLKHKPTLHILESRKGINLETVKNRQLGLMSKRVSIPVKGSDGSIVNVRQWSWEDRERKMINLKGHGQRRLYPLDALDADTIIITEGELKALLLEQYGFAAIAPTGGASTWSKTWNKYFAGKDVIVIYDIDAPGRKGALNVCQNLFRHVSSIKNVVLPINPKEYPTGDVTDFFIKCNQSAFDLKRVIAETPFWTPAPLQQRLEPGKDDDDEIHEVPLAESSLSNYFNKFVRVECVVSAKDTAPFIVPKKYKVLCTKDQDHCAVCPVFHSDQEMPEIELHERDPVILELVNIRTREQPDILKRITGIPKRCVTCQFQMIDTYNIEEVRLIPQLKVASNENEHVVRRAFYLGHGIETNTSYEIDARAVPEPNSQYATLLIFKARSSVDSLSLFKLKEEVHEDLRCFQCAHTAEAVKEKLAEIYTDLEVNVTKIYQRRDMHMLYDLVYHSLLYIPFQGRTHKGWVEGLVLGDSGQGKSETITWLMEHYGLGEKVDSKGASIAGLLGGLQETARRWFISWGVITLNDRRMVVLEEVKGMSTEVIAKMTDARSSGIVEISKIEKARTTCRCRLAWISNPRSQRQLSTYNYGVEAIKELIGSLEDVRRFDLACIVASGDVDASVMNAEQSELPQCEHTYTKDRCRALLLWAWSRGVTDVKFEDSAVTKILQYAQQMGKDYSSSIPLVEVSDQRLKLARLAAALAARVFSCDKSGERLLVKDCHVEVVYEFLNTIYSKPKFGYREYSKLVQGESELEDVHVIKKVIMEFPHREDAVRSMLEASMITQSDIIDWTGYTQDEAKFALGTLVRKRALKRYRTAYVKSPAFLTLLKDLNSNGSLQIKAPKHVKAKVEDDF